MQHLPESTSDESAVRLRPRRVRVRWRLGAGAAVVLVIASAVIAVLMAGAQASGRTRTVEPSAASSPPSPLVASAEVSVYVHVAGHVTAPGLYLLSAGARVADAIAAAGGFNETAERAAVNLARKVVDGEQIVVPAVGAPPSSPSAAGAGGSSGGAGSLLSLSSATAAQLEELPKVGPAMAAKIVAYREQNGPFTSVDQLLEVPGIGEKTLAAFRDRVAP
ncbi:competence protein ComEA [Rathayibacter toxicus]|uniref:helix-hairpin-helix domain-containing protein n=1 Tax=Rathayibacter toxicus TaxID=145458 RepID=UPI001C05977C|nr:helix-hairpin-helix domain-containing protein [Rathayibacter toxicus]QWL27919.1 competence protein ComEA [Rathayibacter toxicus]QWL30035.1 competence protein ComEA [Rathayibacter toxicus]